MEDFLNEYNSRNEEIEKIENELKNAESDRQRAEISLENAKKEYGDIRYKADPYDTKTVEEYQNRSAHDFVAEHFQKPTFNIEGSLVIAEYEKRLKEENEKIKAVKNKLNKILLL